MEKSQAVERTPIELQSLDSVDVNAPSSGEVVGVDGDEGLQPDLSGANIMMIDDAPTTLKILQAFLEDAGYQHFVPITRPAEAFDALIRERPDLVLMDINMPEVSGFDILSYMRNREEFEHTPVIVLTSATDTETKLQALRLGATDFLSKPVDESELVLRLRNTLIVKRYLDQQAYYDRVTDLPNRRLFLERLNQTIEKSIRESTSSAVLLINVDRFKKINENLGHAIGDQLLRAIARRLEKLVRADDLVSHPDMLPARNSIARIGGDEFTLLLSDVDGVNGVESVMRVAERILGELSKSYRIENQELFVTVSIGVAVYPESGTDKDNLLRRADMAMSHAKRDGRNSCQLFSKAIDLQDQRLMDLERDLHNAVALDQLRLHYQPKVDTRTGFVTGAECLVRWEHPERGMVPPNDFIPLAEETGLIGEIGEWVLKEACRQSAEWESDGLRGLKLAVNVSAYQFRRKNFDREVKEVILHHGLVPSDVTLELTESMIIEDAKENIEMLHSLKNVGVKLSIDDFGTGYSSLSYLEQFPLDELKIDRTFVNKIDSASDAPIIGAIIAMSHSLRFQVVAEGVESESQLAFLRANHCELYQGFLFSKPLPANDFAKLARNWRPL